MTSHATDSGFGGPVVLDRWAARRVPPIILLYVAAVFAVFMALSHFVFHSAEAVKALAMAAVAAIVATTPAVVEKIEYRLTESGLEKRTLRTKSRGPFKHVFRWDELGHVVPLRNGFKYFKLLNETSPLRRFWKAQISDQYSGEVHVEKGDLGRVLGILERKGIPCQAP